MNETEKLLKANSPAGTDIMKTPKFRGTLHPSPTMRVRFANGEVVQMNRKERRRLKLYGPRVTKSKP